MNNGYNSYSGKWCSTPDRDGNVECIPFEKYLKMSDAEKKYFNRERGKDPK